ncbi:hypothetical protein AB0G95_21715 [Streptomyces virginiae]|uniref:hypothetical protein n=1 Tax=Streptomyces virginiae TaxID=1961 RepID=UPI0034129353
MPNPTAQPASRSAENADADDLFDSLLYALGAVSALSATVTIQLHTPLPAADLRALADAIEAPGMRVTGPRTVEIIGNTMSAHITIAADIAAGGA